MPFGIHLERDSDYLIIYSMLTISVRLFFQRQTQLCCTLKGYSTIWANKLFYHHLESKTLCYIPLFPVSLLNLISEMTIIA